MIDTTKKIADWCSQFEKKHFSKGDSILQFTEDGSAIYYLESGYVRLLTTTKAGHDLTFAIHKPGTCFPLQFFLSESLPESPYVYEAVTDVIAYKVPRDQFLLYLQADAKVAMYFLARFSNALTGLVIRMEQSALPKPEEIVAVLQYLGRNFAEPTEDLAVVRIPFPLTAEILSTWTGVARETVTRVLSSLKKKKIISSKNLYLYVQDVFLK